MGRLSDRDALAAAWRALEGNVNHEGWRTIPIMTDRSYQVAAGRHFPGNEEALLIGFPSLGSRNVANLPEGRGFAVINVDFAGEQKKHTWFALLRHTSWNLEIFTIMAFDVMANLHDSESKDEHVLFDLFLGRIRAWQRFMERCGDSVLGREAEIGLFGELVMLSALLKPDMRPLVVVESWCGPFDAVHDFRLGNGALEVKTTITSGKFPATIASLEQLDDDLTSPLFPAAVRLRLDDAGRTLPEQVASVKKLLEDKPDAADAFEVRLLHAGFFLPMSGRYFRRFLQDDMKIVRVQEGFPRLIRSRLPSAIAKATYEIDLDSVDDPGISLNNALRLTGVHE